MMVNLTLCLGKRQKNMTLKQNNSFNVNSSIKKSIKLAAISITTVALVACSSYEPVPASECKKVVSHSKKILGSMAPSYKEMMKECEAASDTDRGCAMAAEKPGQLMKCF
jgi:hypothetical protein